MILIFKYFFFAYGIWFFNTFIPLNRNLCEPEKQKYELAKPKTEVTYIFMGIVYYAISNPQMYKLFLSYSYLTPVKV